MRKERPILRNKFLRRLAADLNRDLGWGYCPDWTSGSSSDDSESPEIKMEVEIKLLSTDIG